MSFVEDRVVSEGLTFDDVLLVPAYSEVLPRDVSVRTHLTAEICLQLPIVSAAMDTVTESDMAIALAREGGIGVIHKSMTIDRQAKEVSLVKRAENGMIYDPVTIYPTQTVMDAVRLMREHKIGGIPVIDKLGCLIGIVTNRDLRFVTDMSLCISEVMSSERLITVRSADPVEAEKLLHKHRIEKLPVVDEHNRLKGLLTYNDLKKIDSNPNACKDERGRLRVAAGVGITNDTYDRIDALVVAGADVIVIDTAHGHSSRVIETLRQVREKYPRLALVVGNVATGAAARALAEAGADAVKVGIGPGSICTTRVIAGVGMPQVEAVYEVSQALRGSRVKVIADGGIRYSGDVVKALAAGADTVMLGSLFAGVEESPGETILFNGRRYKTYRGMGSLEAMQHGSKDRYFQEAETELKKLVPEGIAARVPYAGTLSEVVYQIVGGLRAGMGYCGAKDIPALQQAKFVRITNAGFLESHPHDVTITSEAPNYSRQTV